MQRLTLRHVKERYLPLLRGKHVVAGGHPCIDLLHVVPDCRLENVQPGRIHNATLHRSHFQFPGRPLDWVQIRQRNRKATRAEHLLSFETPHGYQVRVRVVNRQDGADSHCRLARRFGENKQKTATIFKMAEPRSGLVIERRSTKF